MNVPDIAFEADRITEDGLVVGRNGYADVPVGTVFRAIAKTRVEGEISSWKTTDLETIAVNLQLAEVWWFRRSIDSIPRGHSAGLRLVGNGMDLLKVALDGKKSGEFIVLRVEP